MIILCIHAFIEFMIGLEAMNLKNLVFLGGRGGNKVIQIRILVCVNRQIPDPNSEGKNVTDPGSGSSSHNA